MLNCHNQRMNHHASLISLLLRRCGSDKVTFKRLNKLGSCLSYKEALNIQSLLSANNENVVKKWSAAQSQDTETLITSDLLPAGIGTPPPDRDSSSLTIEKSSGKSRHVSVVDDLNKSIMEIDITQDNEALHVLAETRNTAGLHMFDSHFEK